MLRTLSEGGFGVFQIGHWLLALKKEVCSGHIPSAGHSRVSLGHSLPFSWDLGGNMMADRYYRSLVTRLLKVGVQRGAAHLLGV